MVALTFDDGPSPKYTERILDALKEYNASATFFVLGSNAEMLPSFYNEWCWKAMKLVIIPIHINN